MHTILCGTHSRLPALAGKCMDVLFFGAAFSARSHESIHNSHAVIRSCVSNSRNSAALLVLLCRWHTSTWLVDGSVLPACLCAAPARAHCPAPPSHPRSVRPSFQRFRPACMAAAHACTPCALTSTSTQPPSLPCALLVKQRSWRGGHPFSGWADTASQQGAGRAVAAPAPARATLVMWLRHAGGAPQHGAGLIVSWALFKVFQMTVVVGQQLCWWGGWQGQGRGQGVLNY